MIFTDMNIKVLWPVTALADMSNVFQQVCSEGLIAVCRSNTSYDCIENEKGALMTIKTSDEKGDCWSQLLEQMHVSGGYCQQKNSLE